MEKWQVEHVERLSTMNAAAVVERGLVGLAFDEDMALHRPLSSSVIWHAERPERLLDTIKEIKDSGLLDICVKLPSRSATREELLLVHSGAHIDDMLGCIDAEPEECSRRAQKFNTIFLNQFSVRCAQLAVGNVLSAIEAVVSGGRIRHGACIVRPPGHHAECDCAMGFCIFNNVAVAAQHARRNFGVER
jgi:acetoin utilization deacetylase AcuC-like enzyme